MATHREVLGEVVMAGKSSAFTDIPEISLRFERTTRKKFIGKISSSLDVAKFLRGTFKPGEIELQEQFIVLYLTNAKTVIGYYRHSRGGLTSTVVDHRIILAVALKCAATGIVMAHNHPSGSVLPSEQDKALTKRIKEAAKILDIGVLDHVIISKENYYSFADEGLLGVVETDSLNSAEREFEKQVETDLKKGTRHNKRSIEALAFGLKITDRTEIKELTELAIVNVAREIALGVGSILEKYERIVKLYNDQVTLSHRTSQSMLLQQYSTPAPIGYLMGVFCGLPKVYQNNFRAFEPSAGNGLLTIAGDQRNIIVNEVDFIRNRNLKTQNFLKVINQDATKPFLNIEKHFNAVLTNPPFGRLDKAVDYNTFPISDLDHLMSLRALDMMADNGKAAIIIGGHTRWDSLGRIQAGKNRIYFNYLYRHYHVLDVLQVDGDKLYRRQGTSFPVRLILIDGRKTKPEGVAPIQNENDTIIKTFEALYERIMRLADEHQIEQTMKDINQLEKEALALQSLFENEDLGIILNDNEKDEGLDSGKLFLRFKDLKQAYPDDVLLMESSSMFLAFNEDAIKMAKALKKLIVKVKSGGLEYSMVGFSKILIAKYIPMFNEAGIQFTIIPDGKKTDWKKLEQDLINFIKIGNGDFSELGAPYLPASQACVVLNTQVPDSMGFETQAALTRIKSEIGGDMDNFVRHRLGYSSHTALCRALSAEQIDAVAMAIYNIEGREQGTIIGDQTGIGKGRIAAAMIRYGVKQGLKPIFITEKASLFSSLYRDLSAIGSADLKPFIVNGKEAKSDIKDEDGNVIFQALPPTEQEAIFESEEVPAWYDFVAGTYSQFNSPEKKPTKPNFLMHISKGNLLIMDESHNSSGSSNTGEFMQRVVAHTKGVVFLSATFAKRPDNMPIYAMKTAISEANLSKEELIEAIQKGGVALQEILSSQLVAEGQMIRRERSFEGVEVNYIALDQFEQQHRKTADSITSILRKIIAFQNKFIDKAVKELDKIAVAEGKEIDLREGTSQAGVDNTPYFSKVFNVINQMLFSIKADAVADRAIERLKEGKKPVIAFASTMGSFIEQMENESGMAVSDGDLINTDFSEVLRRGLSGVMRYTEKDVNGAAIYKKFDLSELSEEARAEYAHIVDEINNASTGISISPIDMIIQKLEAAGYRVAEVTGRKFAVQPNAKGNKGLVTSRKRIATNDAFRMFNNNEMDVLMINQSGSTGESAHAIITPKVPQSEVRQRVMIVLQAELDINIEVQKRGRINRTGQIIKPIYDYVNSAIPAEKRLMMMLQKKLKSLDANTTSNQKQSIKILDVPDFLNKYGNKVVKEYLLENKEINELLGDPLHLRSSSGEEGKSEEDVEDAAHKVSGRVAVLSTKMQADFYTDIAERYIDYVDYLKQIGEYDLEVEALDLKTETIETSIKTMGKGGESAFGDDSILEKVNANILKKPFKRPELENLLNEALANKTAEENKEVLLEDFTSSMEEKLKQELSASDEKYDELIKEVPNEKKVQKILEKEGQGAYEREIKRREAELNTARALALEQLSKASKNRKEHLHRILSFFTIGKKLSYPVVTYDNGIESVLAICLGVQIDKKKKNPFAPSAIKVRVAIANGRKYIAMLASNNEGISQLVSASHAIKTPDQGELLSEWEEEIKLKTKDRGVRFIITGNLLQAFGSETGKLVSYTTMQGETKKGILMPEEWRPKDLGQQKVTVPIVKALPLLKSMTNGTAIYASNGIAFFKLLGAYRIIVPSARSKGGDVYMDQDIWPLINNNKFEIASDKMQATMPENNIEALAEILQAKLSVSVSLGLNQLALIKPNSQRISTRKKIILPPLEDENETERIRMLELEAEALVLELELAA